MANGLSSAIAEYRTAHREHTAASERLISVADELNSCLVEVDVAEVRLNKAKLAFLKIVMPPEVEEFTMEQASIRMEQSKLEARMAKAKEKANG